MDPLELHSRGLAHLRAVVAATPDAAWDTPTSCQPWDRLGRFDEVAGPITAGINDQTRSFGLFAEAPELPEDASPTDRLMARTGRRRP